MAIDTASEPAIGTAKTDVASLRAGDLLHVACFWPYPQVVRNESRKNWLTQNRRSQVTLVDADGDEKRFLWSPTRPVSRVTNRSIPAGPWCSPESSRWYFDIPADLRSWQRDDALWHKVLAPLGRPFVGLWREVLDLQCRAYSLRLRAGFWGILFVVLVAAIALATRTEPELSVAIGIVGAFVVERCWEWWKRTSRRKLAKGISMRVRYKLYGPDPYSYGTLQLIPRGALIVGGTPGQVWFSTEMCLRKRKRALATCAFANDIRGDLTHTTTAVAEAIKHRLDNGPSRVIYAASVDYDPAGEAPPDITMSPSDRWFTLTFADKNDGNGQFSIRLKLHQARVFADALEVMDAGRRL